MEQVEGAKTEHSAMLASGETALSPLDLTRVLNHDPSTAAVVDTHFNPQGSHTHTGRQDDIGKA
jgi:hypothetical protein